MSACGGKLTPHRRVWANGLFTTPAEPENPILHDILAPAKPIPLLSRIVAPCADDVRSIRMEPNVGGDPPLRRLLIYPPVYSFDRIGSHLPRGLSG